MTSARNNLVKSVTDYDGEIPTNVINNITSSFKQNDPVNRSVRKHVKDSIKNRNQQYFKQKQPPSVVRKKTTTTTFEPRIKITDIVNRNISRSSSFSSIAPLNEVEMMSRSGSLDSISTMKREYSDQEMISRPPSVSSIRDFNNDLSFEPLLTPIYITDFSTLPPSTPPPPPLKKEEKKVKQEGKIILRQPSLAAAAAAAAVQPVVETAQSVHPIVKAVRDKFPNENLNPAEIAVITRRKGLTAIPPETRVPLNAAQKAILANKNKISQITSSSLSTTTTRPTVQTSSSSNAPLNATQKAILAKRQQKLNNPPTVSLIASIEKKSTIKKKTAAAKADSKIKRDEVVARWQNKSDDVEMTIPLQTGKRKKSIPKVNPTGDPKYKKEN